MKTFISDLSKNSFPVSEMVSGESVRRSIMELIREDFPEFDNSKYLSLDEMNQYREKYISQFLQREAGTMSDLDRKVLKSLKQRTVITEAAERESQQKLTVGQRIADNVASFGGSWTFIILFALFLALWISVNVFWIANRGFDPFPFILLNLILSCLAAIQAPVIMMSQNRQAAKDRERSKNDYMVNLKSELEVRALHEKIDHMMLHQQQELIEIQGIQIEILTNIQKRLSEVKQKPKPALKKARPKE